MEVGRPKDIFISVYYLAYARWLEFAKNVKNKLHVSHWRYDNEGFSTSASKLTNGDVRKAPVAKCTLW